ATASAAAYNPTTNTWRRVPDAPGGMPLFADAVWTGDEMIIVGTVGGSGNSMPVWQVLALAPNSPAGGGWRTVPPPPLPVRGSPVVVWTGTELVVAGGLVGGGAWTSDGAAYDPRTNEWRALPGAPVGFAGAQRSAEPVAGGRIVVLSTATDDPGTRPLLFDIAAGTWAAGPSLGWPEERRAREDGPVSEATVVSTGDAVIAWGGGMSQQYDNGPAIGCCRPLDSGVRLSLP
ncbi:MAG: hypothetical protein ACRD12_11835, partial [Acidimicrobiales bacterium]